MKRHAMNDTDTVVLLDFASVFPGNETLELSAAGYAWLPLRNEEETLNCFLQGCNIWKAVILSGGSEALSDTIKKLHKLNPLLTIANWKNSVALNLPSYIKMHTANTAQELQSLLQQKICPSPRRFHRADWPLKAYILREAPLKNLEASLFNFSAGGAFVNFNDLSDLRIGDTVHLMVKFSEEENGFRFFTRAKIIRTQAESPTSPTGFVVKFENVPAPTQEAINQMINKYLYKELTKKV